MNTRNKVFIGCSLDGYIADKNGGIDWLNEIPNPDQSDMGYKDFIEEIDAIVMGRNTFETVLGFDCDWPYDLPVFVLSKSLKKSEVDLPPKVEIVEGSLQEILSRIHHKGFSQLYIDGGKTIQNFLKEDLIDDLIISRIPVLLGGGVLLFGDLIEPLKFELIQSKIHLDAIVQSHYKRRGKQNL